MGVEADGVNGLLSMQYMMLPPSEIRDRPRYDPPPPPFPPSALILQPKAEAQRHSATQSSHRSALLTAQ